VRVVPALVEPDSGVDERGRYWAYPFDDVGLWLDPDGRAAEVWMVADSSDEHFFLPVATFTLGVCLNLQGQIAIHANAVDLAGQAVAFVGDSGRGKSTLTAYCLLQGAGLITDDVFTADAQALAQPGYPRLKLLPQTGQQLGLQALALSGLKIHYQPQHLQAKFQEQPVPLRTIYLLEESTDGRIYSETVPPSQAVFALLTHSYHALLGNMLYQSFSYRLAEDPSLLDAYVGLVTQVPVKRLYYPRDFKRLPGVYTFLVNDR